MRGLRYSRTSRCKIQQSRDLWAQNGPGRVFGTGGLVSTIRLRVKAALGGVASAPSAESFEWLTALHQDQPGESTQHRASLNVALQLKPGSRCTGIRSLLTFRAKVTLISVKYLPITSIPTKISPRLCNSGPIVVQISKSRSVSLDFSARPPTCIFDLASPEAGIRFVAPLGSPSIRIMRLSPFRNSSYWF